MSSWHYRTKNSLDVVNEWEGAVSFLTLIFFIYKENPNKIIVQNISENFLQLKFILMRRYHVGVELNVKKQKNIVWFDSFNKYVEIIWLTIGWSVIQANDIPSCSLHIQQPVISGFRQKSWKSLGFCFLKKYISWDEKDTYVTQHAPVCHPLETHYDSGGDEPHLWVSKGWTTSATYPPHST